MNTSIFISEDYLKQNTVINGNVDDKYIVNNLRMVEDVYIHPILGSLLYDELRVQISTSGVTTLNRTLIEDYVQPTVIYFLLAEMPIDMVFKWENKAIIKRSGENSQPADLNDIRYIIERKEKVARFYSERLINYLRANPTLYPLYAQYGATPDKMKPLDSMYNYGGLYLKNNRRRKISLEEQYQGKYGLLNDTDL